MRSRANWRQRRAAGGVTALVGLAIVGLAGCGSPTSKAATHTVRAGTPEVAFVQSAALAANGTIPTDRSALLNCGSSHYGWLSELTHVSIGQAKVSRHWGPFVPAGPLGPGGVPVMAKQMMSSGTIESPNAGATDVPFDHPYGGDETFDEKLLPAYAGLDQSFPAPGQGKWPANLIHDEIQTGLLPHVPGTDQITKGESWPNMATADETNVSPGFSPQSGDQAAVMGSWVTDCGHQDFHPELHSVNFMAFGHRVGNATVAHAFYNPYEVGQVYNPNLALSGAVANPSTLTSSKTQEILHYIVTAITRLAFGQDPAPTVPHVLVPFLSSPAPWQVCAPVGTSGSKLIVSYDFSIRGGVTVTVQPDTSTGCATVTTLLTSSYVPAGAPGQMECPTDWSWLDANAFGQGGVGKIDVPHLILQQVRKISPALAASLAPKVNRPLTSNCYPPLTVSGLATPGPGVHSVVTSANQILPFAGWVRVSWGS